MEDLVLTGKIVLSKNGERLVVLAQKETDKGYTLNISDGKSYDLLTVIKIGRFKFEDDTCQKNVEKFVNNYKEKVKTTTIFPDLEIENAKRILQNSGTKKNVTNLAGEISDEKYIQSMRTYGKTAKKIYLDCCCAYNFDRSLAHYFAKQQILFADKATPEKFAMWMLPHSNLTGTSNGTWVNIVDNNKGVIYEYWTQSDRESINDTRLAFLKQGDGEYVFYGVYELEKREAINIHCGYKTLKIKKTYKRISDTYPIQ